MFSLFILNIFSSYQISQRAASVTLWLIDRFHLFFGRIEQVKAHLLFRLRQSWSLPHMFRLGQQKTVEGSKGSGATIPETTSLALLCFAISWELDQQSKYWTYFQGCRKKNASEENYLLSITNRFFFICKYYLSFVGVNDKKPHMWVYNFSHNLVLYATYNFRCIIPCYLLTGDMIICPQWMSDPQLMAIDERHFDVKTCFATMCQGNFTCHPSSINPS